MRTKITKSNIHPIDHYKHHEANLGTSDYASITLTGCEVGGGVKSEILKFRIDASYRAWVLTADEVVPDHYEKEFEFECWLKTFDDDGDGVDFTTKKSNDKIEVYRAGDCGCIIRGNFDVFTYDVLVNGKVVSHEISEDDAKMMVRKFKCDDRLFKRKNNDYSINKLNKTI